MDLVNSYPVLVMVRDIGDNINNIYMNPLFHPLRSFDISLQINKPSTADDNGSDVFSSGSQESLTAGETSTEWQPTPQIQMKLHSLNNFLRQAGDGRVSPIRSQLSTDVNNISSPTARYYRRKGVQAVESVLDAIAPGQKRWLL